MEHIISLNDLLDSLPDSEKTGSVKAMVTAEYWHELKRMRKYKKEEDYIDLYMYPFRQAGSQFIAEFEVNDRSKPVKNEYNWYLQNTSQWLYAGCILVQNGEVSTHH